MTANNILKRLAPGLFSVLTACMISAAAVAPANSAEIIQPKNVLELFTSQGCHSCPAADKILGNISKGDETLALAWHVDYWDYLGWKDIFGSKANTERQYRYAASLQERQVYTPQAIINGRMHLVGSRKGDIHSTLKKFSGTSNGLTVPITASVSGSAIEINVPLNTDSSDTTLWLVYFDDHKQVDIKRGENAGKKITYHNIVREVEMLGMVKANGVNVTLPMGEMKRKGYTSCAVILQKTTKAGTPGHIVGAAIIKDL